MIILTKINQLDNIDTITDKLKADISQSISILNTAYGVDRDVYNDLGGCCSPRKIRKMQKSEITRN